MPIGGDGKKQVVEMGASLLVSQSGGANGMTSTSQVSSCLREGPTVCKCLSFVHTCGTAPVFSSKCVTYYILDHSSSRACLSDSPQFLQSLM